MEGKRYALMQALSIGPWSYMDEEWNASLRRLGCACARRSIGMWMTAMDVWVGRMLVSQYLVSMQTNMRLVASPWKEMLVLVMIVMAMDMNVLERFVRWTCSCRSPRCGHTPRHVSVAASPNKPLGGCGRSITEMATEQESAASAGAAAWTALLHGKQSDRARGAAASCASVSNEIQIPRRRTHAGYRLRENFIPGTALLDPRRGAPGEEPGSSGPPT